MLSPGVTSKTGNVSMLDYLTEYNTVSASELLQNDGGSGVSLSYIRDYKRLSDTYSYDFTNNAVLNELRRDGQLLGLVRATLTNDLHNSLSNHFGSERLAAQCIRLFQSTGGTYAQKLYYCPIGEKQINDNDYSYGDPNSDIFSFSPDQDGSKINLRVVHTGCVEGCGSCYVRDFAFLLLDRSAPCIKAIRSSADAEGATEKSSFKGGERVYLHLDFSEYIRFAAGAFPSGSVPLRLLVKSNESGLSTQGLDVNATLYSLKDKTLSFYYDIPEASFSVNGKSVPVNHTIIGIDDTQSALFSQNKDFPLKLFYGNGDSMSSAVALFNDSDKLLSASASLITDLAGNSASAPSGVMFSAAKECRIDAIAPYISSVSVESDKAGDKTSGTQETTHAGVGEALSFSLLLSEALDPGCIESGDLGSIKATLNILDGSTPVELTASKVETRAKSGVSAYGYETKLSFAPLTITDTMKSAAETYENTSTYLPVGINRLTLPGGKDLSGNALDASRVLINVSDAAKRLLPDTQLYLDTRPPEAALGDDTPLKNGRVEPRKEGSRTDYFCVHVLPRDEKQLSGSKAYASGIFDQTGYFSLGEYSSNTQPSAQYSFSYAVTGDAAMPASWLAGTTSAQGKEVKLPFSQLGKTNAGDGNYIHILLTDGQAYTYTEPSLRLYARDFAQNETPLEWKLDVDMDSKAPEITEISENSSFNSVSSSGILKVEVSVSDPSGVDTTKLYYKWIEKGDAIPSLSDYPAAAGNGWVQVTGLPGGCLTALLENLAANMVYERTLLIAATDNSAARNKTITALEGYVFNKSLPQVSINVSGDYSSSPTIEFHTPRERVSESSTNRKAVEAYVLIKDKSGESGEDYYFVAQTTNPDQDLTSPVREYANWDSVKWFPLYDQNTYNFVKKSSASGGYQLDVKANNTYRWSYAKVTESNGSYTFSDVQYWNTTTALPAGAQARIDAIFNNSFYGDMDLTLLYGYGASMPEPHIDEAVIRTRELSDGFMLDPSSTFTVKHYLFHALGSKSGFTASASSCGALRPTHGVTITPVNAAGAPEDTSVRESLVCGRYSGADGGASYVTSLAGGSFRIEINNLADAAYGVSDIAPSSGYIHLYKAASGAATETPVWESKPAMSWPLDAGASKLNLSLTSAEAAALGSGRFKLVVYFKTLGGMTISKEYTEIYQHTLELPSFGAAGTESSYAVFGKTLSYKSYPGYRKGENTAQNYDIPPLYLTGANGHDAKLYFTACNAQTGPLFAGAESFKLKVWNETANESESGTQWTAMGGSVGTGADCYKAFSPSELSLKSGANLLKYRLKDGNETSSAVKSLTLYYSTAAPSLKMYTVPDAAYVAANGLVKEGVNLPSALVSNSGAPIVELRRVGSDGAIPVSGDVITSDGVYQYYCYDGYGSFAADALSVSGVIKGDAPVISSFTDARTDEEKHTSMLHFKASVTESRIDEGLRLFFKPEKANDSSYKSTAVDGYDGDWIELPINTAVGEHEYNTITPSGGLFYLKTSRASGSKTISIEAKAGLLMCYTYKNSGGVPDGDVPVTLTLRASDRVGHDTDRTLSFSDARSYRTGNNVAATLTKDSSNRLWMKSGLNEPMYIADPSEMETAGAFSMTKELLCYNSGSAHRFTYKDAAGALKSALADPDDLTAAIGDYGMDVKLSESAPTKGPVYVTLSIEKNTKLSSLALPDSILGVSKKSVAANNKSATLTISENTTINVTLTHAASGEKQVIPVKISNIDTTPPSATLYWRFDECGLSCSDAELRGNPALLRAATTTGRVRAYLESDELLYDTSGGGLYYDFVYYLGHETSHRFTYSDKAGNAGTPITATLPVTLAAAQAQDTTPPDYSVDIDRYTGGAYAGWDSFSPSAGGGVSKLSAQISANALSAGQTAGYQLRFAIRDQSPARIILKNSDVSSLSYLDAGDAIDGVQLSGRTISITKNVSFYAMLVDANNNLTKVHLNIESIDDKAPSGTVAFERVGFYAQKATVSVTDNTDVNNASGSIKALDASQGFVPSDGKFVRTFYENPEPNPFDFRIVDKNGVAGAVKIDVPPIDDKTASLRILGYSPGLLPKLVDGVTRFSAPPSGPVNTDVSVFLEFDKDVIVDSSGLLYASGGGLVAADESVAVVTTQDGNHATLTFKQSASVLLRFASLNGKKDSRIITIASNVIDKTPPVISDSLTPANYQSDPSARVSFAFTPNETVLDGAGKEYAAGEVIKKTVTENGRIDFSFTDLAGNTTVKTYTLENIDTTPPIVVLPKTGAVAETTSGARVKASLSESGYLKLVSSTEDVKKAAESTSGWTDISAPNGEGASTVFDYHEFSAARNGSYWLVGKDKVGYLTYTSVAVSCIDTTPPSLKLNPVSVSIKRGASQNELNALLSAGVTASDDKSASPTVSRDQSGVNLDVTGSYPVVYTATDEALNSRSLTRYVRVYDENEPRLLVNGEKTYEDITCVITGTRSVVFSAENLKTANEPYSIYVMAGKRTAGQLKRGAKVSGGSYTFAADGLYTALLVTQSRQSFVTTIYVRG